DSKRARANQKQQDDARCQNERPLVSHEIKLHSGTAKNAKDTKSRDMTKVFEVEPKNCLTQCQHFFHLKIVDPKHCVTRRSLYSWRFLLPPSCSSAWDCLLLSLRQLQLSIQEIHELAGGAPGSPVMKLCPLQGFLLQLISRNINPALACHR